MRDVLLRQWRTIADAVPSLDLDTPSRIDGWRNREVLAHLSLQPKLLVHFLTTASREAPVISLVGNLSGTSRLADMIDQSARRAAGDDLGFAENVERALPALDRADLTDTVTTLQGPIVLSDYLRTRCVEAVVHGGDFVDPVVPDAGALEIACAALRDVLADRHPELLSRVESLPPTTWLNIATGREEPPRDLSACCPLMT